MIITLVESLLKEKPNNHHTKKDLRGVDKDLRVELKFEVFKVIKRSDLQLEKV